MQKGLRSRSRRSVILLAGIIFVLIAATAVFTVVAAQNTGINAKPTVLRSIAILPPVKQTAAAQAEATRSVERLTPHPELRQPLPTQQPTATPILGILANRGQNPWNPKQPADTLWRGYINGVLVTVWAGRIVNIQSGGVPQNTEQGYVAVGIGDDFDGPNRDYHQYLTPTLHGAIDITAVNGSLVTLTAKDGTPYTFDLNTRTFS